MCSRSRADRARDACLAREFARRLQLDDPVPRRDGISELALPRKRDAPEEQGSGVVRIETEHAVQRFERPGRPAIIQQGAAEKCQCVELVRVG